MIWQPSGTTQQQGLVSEALARCDFPWDALSASLAAEGKTAIRVDWEDLSRAVGDAATHAVTRDADGSARTLGLFYLPPNTRVVLDVSLTASPELAWEVMLAEAAHAVDYHYLTDGMRVAVWNAVHGDSDDLGPGAAVPDSGDISHGHSWFDGRAGYATWVGEAFMQVFVAAFAPTVPVTIQLAHPVTAEAAATVRDALMPPTPTPTQPAPPPTPTPPSTPPPDGCAALAAALRRYLARRAAGPAYLVKAARAWLDALGGRPGAR